MKYKAVFLDFYGTLAADDGAIIDRISRAVAGASPVSGDLARVDGAWRFHALCDAAHGGSFRTQRAIERESIELLAREFEVALDAEALCAELFAHWRAPAAFPETGPFLASLAVPACVVSNIDTDDVAAAIAHNGWRFDAVITSETCRAYKPRPAMFQAALARLGLEAHEVLHVGDSWAADVRGAQVCGIDVAWVNRARRARPAGGGGPTFTVGDLGELTGLLAREGF